MVDKNNPKNSKLDNNEKFYGKKGNVEKELKEGEEFYVETSHENYLESNSMVRRDENDPHFKYNQWKKQTTKEVAEENKRYQFVLENLKERDKNKIDSFTKQNCSFQCLIDISKRQKGKDFYICCYKDCEFKEVICRECAESCHKPKHLKEEKFYLDNVINQYDKIMKEKDDLLKIIKENKKKKIEGNDYILDSNTFEQNFRDIKKKNNYKDEYDLIAKEFYLAYEYEKYNCEREKLEIEDKDKFLENYCRRNLRLYKIDHKFNYELICKCGFHEDNELNKSKLEFSEFEKRKEEEEREKKCHFTQYFSNTKKSTNFYIFEKYINFPEASQKENVEHRNNQRAALSKYIEERRMGEEKRSLLNQEGKTKFDKMQKYVVSVDKLVKGKKDESYKLFCAFCVDNCIMPHFEFKKDAEEIPIPIAIDKIKNVDFDNKECQCWQHEKYFDFDYKDNIADYSLNFNFNVFIYSKFDDISRYLKNYKNNKFEVDFNDFYFLHSLEVFKIFDLYYNSKFYLPSNNFLENLNINENVTADYIKKETLKIIEAYCRDLDNLTSRKENDVDFVKMNRSFSSKIIFLYMIFYKTTKTLVVKKFAHFSINSIVNMTVPQRYLYIYHNHKYIFKEHLESTEFEIFKNQFFLFVEIFLSYMDQDIYAIYDDVDDDNYSLIHKIFKLIFKFNFSKIYNKEGKKNKKNIFDGKEITYLLEKKYLDIIHKIFEKNKSKRKRCLSESSYYILKSIFFIIYRINDEAYYNLLINKEFNHKNYEKVFFKGELSEVICKVTLMCLDNYDSSKNPGRSLKFQLYSKYVLDVIIDKNKNYNIGIYNLHYLRDSSFDVILNPNAILTYIKSEEHREIDRILNDLEAINWKYNNNDDKNNYFFDEYVRECTKHLQILVDKAKSILGFPLWDENFLLLDKLNIYSRLDKLNDDLKDERKVQRSGKLSEFQKIIKYNKFISVMDCFILNYSEANMKDIRRSKCRERLPSKLRRELLVFFVILIYEEPENFNLIMSIDGSCFANLFLERYDREEFSSTYIDEIFNKKWNENNEENNQQISSKKPVNRPNLEQVEREENERFSKIQNENFDIEFYLKFLSITSDIISSSKFVFTNLKFFTDSMIETCKFIYKYRNEEIKLIELLGLRNSSPISEFKVINDQIKKKFQFIKLYINHYKDTIGKSSEEKAIQDKLDSNDDQEEHEHYKLMLERIYNNELIDILLRNSVTKITFYLGKFIKIFCKIFKHLTLMNTETLDCLEHVVTLIKKCSNEGKIFKFSIEKFIKNRIPLYEKDAVETFMKYYLKLYCQVFYNSLSFMRIFKYDTIVGGIFNALKKDYVIPEKLPMTLQMEIVKFTFTQIEIDFDLQQPIEQDIPFKSEYFWMAQKKPRFLYENDDKRKFNPLLALKFALNSINNCERYVIEIGDKFLFKNGENDWRKKHWNDLEEYEKKREEIDIKGSFEWRRKELEDTGFSDKKKDESDKNENSEEENGKIYLKKEKNEKKMYRNCIRYFQNCCLKSMFFLTCFEEIYNLYENQELMSIVKIVTSFARTVYNLYEKILTEKNYNLHFKESSRFIRKVYFDKLEFFAKFYLNKELKDFVLDKDEIENMEKLYFLLDSVTTKGRKLLHKLLNYKPFPISSSSIFNHINPDNLEKYYDNHDIIKFLSKDVQKMDKFDKKIENSKLSIISVFENNEENIPLYNIFLDIVMKNLFSKVSYLKLSSKQERFKLFYHSDQSTFKLCYEDLEWHNSIYLYYLKTVFSYNSNIFQMAFYSKISQEKELWNDFLIFLVCFYCWNLSLHVVMRTRDLVDLRMKSNFIIDLNISSIKILQNLCEGHNKTFQDYLFSFEFNVKKVKDLFWGKSVYISREEIDKNVKYKIYNFINCNKLNLFHSLKRRIFPKDRGVLMIMQKYIDLIVEMIQGAGMSNLKNVTNRLRFLDERTKFENEYNYEEVKKIFTTAKISDNHLTDKRFFKKNNFHKNDDLNDRNLVKKISLEKYLNKIDLYEPEYFDFYSMINDIKHYLVNDYYLVDEMVIRLQSCIFEYFNNILKSDIDQDRKNGVEVFTKFFKVEEIIILLMKYFLIIKYKYLHNAELSTGNPPVKNEYNENEIIVTNIDPTEPNKSTRKKEFPEPKIIELDEIFLTEDELNKSTNPNNKKDYDSKSHKDREKLKSEFRKVKYPDFKKLMRIYKQKTGPLFYHMGQDVIIYDDPIFQTACKLMIYLKILAYKYQNTEAQKILDVNLSPYIKAQMEMYDSSDKKQPNKKEKTEKENSQTENDNKNKSESENDGNKDSQTENESMEDIKKLYKISEEIINQYNFNYEKEIKDHKYLKKLDTDDYKDTLIYCLLFFSKVIKSCEFVFPIKMFEESKLSQKICVKEEVVDSEDDKDGEEELEEDEEEKKFMDQKQEENKKNKEKKVNKNKSKRNNNQNNETNQNLTSNRENNNENENNFNDSTRINEKDWIDESEEESDSEIKKKKKKKKTDLTKKEKDEDEDENEEDWEIEKKKKEEYEREMEEERNKDIFNQIKFDKEIQEKKESSKQLKKLHYVFDPKYYYKISKENINEFYETDADRSSSNNKISSLLDAIDKFIIEIEFKNSNESFEKTNLMAKITKVFFEKKMYKNINIMNFFTSLFAVCYLFMFLDQMNYESIEVYYFIYGPLILLILLNSFTIFMFLKAKYPYFKSIELKKLYEGQKEDFKPDFIDEIYAKFLNSFLFHNDIIFLTMNLVTSMIMLFRPNYIFLFCFQLTTIINFYPKVEEIFMAFSSKITQLFAMIIFLAILIYVYAFIGFFYLQGEFNVDTDSGYEENLCNSMIQCAITYFNLGVRSGGGIGDILTMRSFTEPKLYTARYFSDMIFYITVILLLLNMVNGVIVTTFSQIRQERETKEEDKENKCFICSINRVEFEKRKIPFEDHNNKEHSYKTYIKYLLHLKFKNEDEMDYDESHIYKCIEKKDVGCFPIKRAFSIGRGHDIKDEEDDD